MQSFPPTVVWRHRKENLRKCSLRGLESREDFRFYTYPRESLSEMDGYIVLAMDAPVLSNADSACGLLVIDATWRYAEKMLGKVQEMPGLLYRRLPDTLITAYPRCQDDCSDPGRGLASIEAVYASYHILGRNTDGLLNNYHWKDEFIKKNTYFSEEKKHAR